MTENQDHRRLMTEDEARAALAEYKERTGKSQNEIAKELGYSNATAVSRFNSGQYESPDEFIKKVMQLFKITVQRDVAPKRPDFKMTSASRQVTNLITLCHVQGELGVAYGDPGVGKTMAVRQYKKDNPDAIVITVSPTKATITGVCKLIAVELKIKERTASLITDEIIAKLKGSKRVIIVDEAQHLKAKVVNQLRCIVDATLDEETGDSIGMALIGNDEIYYELKVRQAVAYKQLDDRVIHWAELKANEIKLDDVKLIFSEADFDKGTLEVLHKISTSVSVRKAVHVFTNALILFGIKDYADLTTAKLAKVAKEMHIRVAL